MISGHLLQHKCRKIFIARKPITFSQNNEEKELKKNETDQILENKFELEARNDLQHLLKRMVNASENKNGLETHNETETKTNIENNLTLMDRLDQVLKQLGIKRRHIDKSSITVDNVLDENVRLDEQFEWDTQDLSFNGRHRDLMKNLASGHRDAVKNRLINLNRDTRFEDQFNTDKNFRFNQLMKNLDSNHKNAVKSRIFGENVIHRTYSNSDFNNVLQVPKNKKVRSPVYPKIATYRDKIKVPKEEVIFSDLLNNVEDDYNKYLKEVDVKQDYNKVSDVHMRTEDNLHSDSNKQMHLNQFAKALDTKNSSDSKVNKTNVSSSNVILHSNNNNEMDALMENFDINQETTSYATATNVMETTDKLHSYYNDNLDPLINKMYLIRPKDNSKETVNDDVRFDDMFDLDNKNQSYNLVEYSDINNREESTANISSDTNLDLRSEKELTLNLNTDNDLEYRPVIDISEYGNKSEIIYNMSDPNYHLKLLMRNLLIKNRHDKQRIVVNLKQNTERLQKLVKKMALNYSLAGDDENSYIADPSYRVQKNMNNFNDENIPVSNRKIMIITVLGFLKPTSNFNYYFYILDTNLPGGK